MRSPKILLILVAVALATPLRAEITVKELADRVRVEIGGKLFTEYRHQGAPHVYYYPLIGPGGAKMTRSWPMEDVPGEEHDHPHHRSLWYSHGAVNGVDFWSETKAAAAAAKHPVGKIVHEKLIEAKGGVTGVIKAQLKWEAPDGTVPLRSLQTFRVQERGEERLIDFEVVLTAGDKDVVLGDTKEGTMAIRIAESMRLTQPKKQPGQGQIVTATGESGAKVWGKRAPWVDMSGPVDGKTVGIAMFDHPKNPRHPTRWHARDYGLFAANPFCEREMDPTKEKGAGDFKLAAGQSATFRYGIYIHAGTAEEAKVAQRYAEWSGRGGGGD